MTPTGHLARHLPTVLGRAEVLDACTVDRFERIESRSMDEAIAAVGRGEASAVILALLLPGGNDADVGTLPLVARVRATLPALGGGPAEPLVAHDGLRIDRAAREAMLDGSVVELTRREFDLLAFLAATPRRAYSRDELLRHVWSSCDQWQDPATVTEHVRRIRRKIERDPQNPRWITTVRSVGYRFEPAPAR